MCSTTGARLRKAIPSASSPMRTCLPPISGSMPSLESSNLSLLRRARRRVQRHRGANERLQRLFIDLVAFTDIDGAPHIAFEAGVEEACRVLQRGAPGEGQLHDLLVRLAGADDAVVLPH